LPSFGGEARLLRVNLVQLTILDLRRLAVDHSRQFTRAKVSSVRCAFARDE
jgi:hypothetical protein